MVAAFEALHAAGYDGYLRSDHAPQLAINEAGSNDGYSLEGHIFAIGYLRGLDQAARRRTQRR
jgi:mannonate dehydratase